MRIFDLLPARVRVVIQEQGVKAMKEYLSGNVSRFVNTQDGDEYAEFEEL